jgi:hypothetical protein
MKKHYHRYLLICSLAVAPLAAEPQESKIRLSLNQKIALGVGAATAVVLSALAWYSCTHKKEVPVVAASSPCPEAEPQEVAASFEYDGREDQIESGSDDVVEASKERAAQSVAMQRKFTDRDEIVARAQELIKNTSLVNESDQESLHGDSCVVGHSRSPSLKSIGESDLGHVSDREVLGTISQESVQKPVTKKALTL